MKTIVFALKAELLESESQVNRSCRNCSVLFCVEAVNSCATTTTGWPTVVQALRMEREKNMSMLRLTEYYSALKWNKEKLNDCYLRPQASLEVASSSLVMLAVVVEYDTMALRAM